MTDVKPMRADARRNYERLLEEAQRAFAEHGVEASLEEVARRAGVGIGTLYRHFPTRDALLETLLRARFDAQAERARELLNHPEPLQALQTWLAGLGDATGTFRGLVELTADALNDESSRLYESCHTMREAGSQLVERAKRAGELRGDVTADELLLLLHATSWAGGYLPGEGGSSGCWRLFSRDCGRVNTGRSHRPRQRVKLRSTRGTTTCFDRLSTQSVLECDQIVGAAS